MDRKRTIRVVLNPVAGRGAGARVRAEVEHALRSRCLDFSIAETQRAGHAAEIAAAAAAEGFGVVAAVGGDGTVHEVANGLMRAHMDARPTLALVPVGTGNDLVKVVAGTRSRTEAYETLASGSPVPLDVGHASWSGGAEYFVNAMGTGIDVEVVRQIRGIRNLPGAAVYVLGLVKALAKYRALRLRVTMDGTVLDRRFMMAAVANGRCVGGAFHLCPGAAPDDGLLDVCLIDQLSLAGSARVAMRILRGRHMGHPAVHHVAARRVTMEAADGAALFFQLDGELREPIGAAHVTVEVVPGALSVLSADRAVRDLPTQAVPVRSGSGPTAEPR